MRDDHPAPSAGGPRDVAGLNPSCETAAQLGGRPSELARELAHAGFDAPARLAAQPRQRLVVIEGTQLDNFGFAHGLALH
jgi:hypothetical protein